MGETSEAGKTLKGVFLMGARQGAKFNADLTKELQVLAAWTVEKPGDTRGATRRGNSRGS